MFVDTEGSDAPYSEGRLKMWMRKHFASKEARAGIPKEASWRERSVRRICCVMAVAYLLLAVLLAQLWWAQTLCIGLCVFWCGLAGLYESASQWERESQCWLIDSDVEAYKRLSEPPSRAQAEIARQVAAMSFATVQEFNEAVQREIRD